MDANHVMEMHTEFFHMGRELSVSIVKELPGDGGVLASRNFFA